jgi:hypothetical protein
VEQQQQSGDPGYDREFFMVDFMKPGAMTAAYSAQQTGMAPSPATVMSGVPWESPLMRCQSKPHGGSRDDGWTTVANRHGAKPTPKQATLGDFIVGNRFSIFENEDNNDMATTTTCSNTAKQTIKGDICTDSTKLFSDFSNLSKTGLPIGPQLTGTAKGEGSSGEMIKETDIYNTNFPPLTARSSGTTTTTTTTATIPIRPTTTHKVQWPANNVENEYESILEDLFGSSDGNATEDSGGVCVGSDEAAGNFDDLNLGH